MTATGGILGVITALTAESAESAGRCEGRSCPERVLWNYYKNMNSQSSNWVT